MNNKNIWKILIAILLFINIVLLTCYCSKSNNNTGLYADPTYEYKFSEFIEKIKNGTLEKAEENFVSTDNIIVPAVLPDKFEVNNVRYYYNNKRLVYILSCDSGELYDGKYTVNIETRNDYELNNKTVDKEQALKTRKEKTYKKSKSSVVETESVRNSYKNEEIILDNGVWNLDFGEVKISVRANNLKKYTINNFHERVEKNDEIAKTTLAALRFLKSKTEFKRFGDVKNQTLPTHVA